MKKANKDQIIALIPARSGSKGIPGKNIKYLNEKPLIAYTIEAAKHSRLIDRIIVSTDDKTIAKVSMNYGAEAPFLRPKKMAEDSTPTLPVLRHAIKWLRINEKYVPEIVVLLQPTSPLRTSKMIDSAIRVFLKSGRCTTVSVNQVKENPYWMKILQNGYLRSFKKNDLRITRRQDLPDVYMINGAIYICRTELLFGRDPYEANNVRAFIMDRKSSIDIDAPEDFFLVEKLMKRGHA